MAVLQVYQHGFDSCSDFGSPVWVMVIAGFFVGLGVFIFGERVIETVGKSLTGPLLNGNVLCRL